MMQIKVSKSNSPISYLVDWRSTFNDVFIQGTNCEIAFDQWFICFVVYSGRVLFESTTGWCIILPLAW